MNASDFLYSDKWRVHCPISETSAEKVLADKHAKRQRKWERELLEQERKREANQEYEKMHLQESRRFTNSLIRNLLSDVTVTIIFLYLMFLSIKKILELLKKLIFLNLKKL